MKDKMIALVQSYKHYIFISLVINIVLVVIVVSILYSIGGLPNRNNTPSVTANLSTVDSTTTDDGQHESRIVEIVEETSPAVVSIVISKDVPIIERYYRNYDPFGGFGGLFGGFGGFQVPEYRQRGTEKREVGGGTGFFVSSEGLIVTNRHVVSDESATYTVLTNDGKKHDAKVISRDTLFDIALLQVEGNNFAFLEFGDSSKVKPGQTAIAIGNTLAEFSNSVSVGVISGLSRSIIAGDGMGNSENLNNVIQTDAAINPGNSGGPLMNLRGEVIGVNVAQASGSENVGFALPGDTVKSIVQSIKTHGSIVRPYLGLRYTAITPEIIEKNNLSVEYGVLVSRGETIADLAVIPGSPADKAGILENDIITAVDGVELRDGVQLNEIIGQKSVGQQVTLSLVRKGERLQIRVKLEKQPKSGALSIFPQ